MSLEQKSFMVINFPTPGIVTIAVMNNIFKNSSLRKAKPV